MTSPSAGRPLLTISGLAVCLLLLLTGCGDEQPAAELSPQTVSELAPRSEGPTRSALAALDPCALLVGAGVEGATRSLHACMKLGAESVTLNVGVRLDNHDTQPLTSLGGVRAIESDGDPCRVLLPASTRTGIEVIADRCDLAGEVATSVVEQLASGDVAMLSGVVSHDACALLETVSGGAAVEPDPGQLEACSAADASAAGDPPEAGSADPDPWDGLVTDGTTLVLRELTQSPQDMLDSRPGASLVDIAGRPTIFATLGGACSARVRPDPADSEPDPAGPFGRTSTWVQIHSTVHDCVELRGWVERLVTTAASEPDTLAPSTLLYPADG